MKDNFSSQAPNYAKYRPRYPKELFEFITGFCKEKNLAWDCGTGNGQTAKELSVYFDQVYATDISSRQIENAEKANNIVYVIEPAEKTGMETGTADLVTVSQALHWFGFDDFYREVKRVSKPGAIIAVWTYSLLQVDPVTDALIHEHHFDTLEKYWDAERKYVDNGYKTIPFPFERISSPGFFIEAKWNTDELEGYFNTWSALQKFIAKEGYNPVPELMEKIKENWHSGTKKIIFPIQLLMGYV